MAAPLRAEWSPTSLAVKPNEAGPIEVVAKRNRFSNSAPVNAWSFPSSGNWKVLTVVEDDKLR